jgi:hypothetical protein
VLLVNVVEKLSSPAPARDRALIVYGLLVRLSLLFQVTKGLTIPKFGVLSFSSSTSTVYAVQVQATAVV